MSLPENVIAMDGPGFFEVEGEAFTVVPDGTYDLKFIEWETRSYWNAPKVEFRFRIVTPGDYFDLPLSRFYNIRRSKGKFGRNGGFVAPKSGDLVRELSKVFPIYRPDRIPMSHLENHIIVGKTRTVRKDFRQKKLAAPVRYSILSELLKVRKL